MAITPETPGSISPPKDINSKAAGQVDVPNTLTSEAAGQVAIPNTLNAEAAGQVSAPNTLSSQAVGSVAAPNTLNSEAAQAIAVPNDIGALTPSPFPRTLCPLVSLNFAADSYAQCGTAKDLLDIATYSRASSATFINRTTRCGGGYDYFVDTDYVGDVENLVTYSEQFDNADWVKVNSTITSNSTASPDGTMTADKLTDNPTSGLHTVDSASINIVSGDTYTGSFYVKNIDIDVVRVDFSGFSNWLGTPYAAFNISAGVLLETGSAEVLGSIESVGQGWYRISLTATASATTTSEVKLTMTDGTATGASYAGSFESCYIWGAQLTESAKPLPYVKTLNVPVTETFAESLRLEYDPETGESLGALIEGGSTNLVTYSEQFDNAAWTKTGNSSVSQNATLAPDGTFSADIYTNNEVGSVATSIQQSFTGVSLSAYTGAFWIKNISGTGDVTLTIGDSNNTLPLVVSGDWVRYQLTDSSVSTTSVRCYVRLNEGGDSIAIWGAQLEELPFASSYIRTEGGAVSRSADDLSMPSAGNFNASEYSTVSKINGYSFENTESVTNYIYRIDSVNLTAVQAKHNSGHNCRAYNNGDVLSGQLLSDNTNYSIVLSYDGVNSELYIDSISQAQVPTQPVSGQSTIFFNNAAGAGHLFGHIAEFSTYNLSLTAQEVGLL